MEKFKIYRGIAIITVLCGITLTLLPYSLPVRLMDMFSLFSMFEGILMFVCYALLAGIFNFYNEPLWKKLSIWLFILGTILFNVVIRVYNGESKWMNFLLLLYYTPLAVAFITVTHEKIKPVAQSFGYILIIVCLLRLALPFISESAYFSIYANAFSIVYMMPLILIAILFHKMATASDNNYRQERKSGEDLL